MQPAAVLAARAEGGDQPHEMTEAELEAAVQLADACAQGMWGSAHVCMTEPLEVTQVGFWLCWASLGLSCTSELLNGHFLAKKMPRSTLAQPD